METSFWLYGAAAVAVALWLFYVTRTLWHIRSDHNDLRMRTAILETQLQVQESELSDRIQAEAILLGDVRKEVLELSNVTAGTISGVRDSHAKQLESIHGILREQGRINSAQFQNLSNGLEALHQYQEALADRLDAPPPIAPGVPVPPDEFSPALSDPPAEPARETPEQMSGPGVTVEIDELYTYTIRSGSGMGSVLFYLVETATGVIVGSRLIQGHYERTEGNKPFRVRIPYSGTYVPSGPVTLQVRPGTNCQCIYSRVNGDDSVADPDTDQQ